MILAILGHDFVYEMDCVTRIFFPGEQITTVNEYNFTCSNVKSDSVKHNNIIDKNLIVTLLEHEDNGDARLTVRVRLDDFDRQAHAQVKKSTANFTAECERQFSYLLFNLLCEKTGRRPVWGILTGIRPVRLCGKWAQNGLDDNEIFDRLTQDYLVSSEKALLCLETGKAQKEILELNTPESFSLYVSIPFCPTRCLYCSFVSHAIDRAAKLVPDYVQRLCEEIRYTAKIAKDMGLKLLTVYVGGGTPTTLSPEQLEQILSAVNDSFDISNLLEYTVEAGRPDTITAEKLGILKSFGVDRISINPQSMNDDVLNAIGRAHNSLQTLESFELARRAEFEKINMDLIAGLPSETIESFAESLDKVIGLTPENITVHALTVKRSSSLRENPDAFSAANPESGKMLDYCAGKLNSAGYFPYYLYRQKATVDNLENTGYSKHGCKGIYNIYSMEDTHNILAVGAGAVSKLSFGTSDISRINNYKYPYEYLGSFEEILRRKGALYARYH